MAYHKPAVLVQKKKAQSLSFYIAVPKKEIPLAVNRNKVKRRIRVILKENIKEPCIVKVHVSKQAIYLPFYQLQDIIKSQLL